jgi:ATP-dependent exoDNAse (exonuclease V) beta subunit
LEGWQVVERLEQRPVKRRQKDHPGHAALRLSIACQTTVMACDDEVLPLQSRIESVADEVELDDVYETERQLLYVACTRARDRLWVSGIDPASEFLNDLKPTTAK